MRSTLLAVAALAFLRIVIGLHFFLEGLSHLRDPEWSSVGFRKAAVGPLGDRYRASLPETGDWSGTIGKIDGRDADEAVAAWRSSIVSDWRRRLDDRLKKVPLDEAAKTEAAASLDAAAEALEAYCDELGDDLADFRREAERLAMMERRPGADAIPFERERVTKKRRELAGKATSWMADASAIGNKLVGEWDARLPDAATRRKAAAEASTLWKTDRFVSWSLITIGACLVLGVLVKFNAMGGVCFLASVVAAQPFWVSGAQPTYNQWVELAALLAIAALPTGGWSGLDYFLKSWCPWSCCSTGSSRVAKR